MRVAWEISVSPRASLGTSSALCLAHMSLRNVQADRRTDSRACKKTDRWKISNKEDERQPKRGRGKRWREMTTERAKGQHFSQTEGSFGVSLLALGHYLAPLLHHVLLLICHSARGSPAHVSRGPAVTVLMPKITSTNGREAEGTDQ